MTQLDGIEKVVSEILNLKNNPALSPESLAEYFYDLEYYFTDPGSYQYIIYTSDDYSYDYYYFDDDEEDSFLTVIVDFYNLVFLDIEQASELTYLDLSFSNLKSLRPEVWQLSNLSDLLLSSNNLSAIPPQIANLTNLRVLDLSYNQLEGLPGELGELKNLSQLKLYGNKKLKAETIAETFVNYPKSIVYTSDDYIDYYGTDTLFVKVDLLHLVLLDKEKAKEQTSMFLENLNLGIVPSVIWEMTNLTELDLSANGLSAIPPEIGNLRQLVYLNLSDNHLTTLPIQTGKLSSLVGLNLQGNTIEDLPKEMVELKNLSLLNLKNNPQLKPEIIKRVFSNNSKEVVYTSQEYAYLEDYNKLLINVDFSALLVLDFDKAVELTIVDLSNSKLSKLPPEIYKLTNLAELDLSSNEIESLPENLAELKNLTLLNLEKNPQLKPEAIMGFVNDYPKEIVYSSGSYAYNEDNNKLMINVDFPYFLILDNDEAKKMTSLDLSYSELTNLQPEIGQFTNLESLDLSGNALTELPSEIGQLTNLTELFLSGNQFSDEEKEKIKNLLPNCVIYF